MQEEPTEELVTHGRVHSGHTWTRVHGAVRVGHEFRIGEEAWGEGRIIETSDSVIVVSGARRMGHGGLSQLTCTRNPAAVAVGARIVPHKGQAVVHGYLALYGGQGCELAESKGLDVIGLFMTEVAMGVTRVLGEPEGALELR